MVLQIIPVKDVIGMDSVIKRLSSNAANKAELEAFFNNPEFKAEVTTDLELYVELQMGDCQGGYTSVAPQKGRISKFYFPPSDSVFENRDGVILQFNKDQIEINYEPTGWYNPSMERNRKAEG